MVRESLGTVRIHRWTCDVDGTIAEHKSKASGTIPMPPGWMAVRIWIEDAEGQSRTREGHVCSGKCAAAFSRSALTEETTVAEPAE